MELRHLRYFVAVAEAGSLTKAGSALRVAQPALSRQIRDLEREVGVALFERHPRGVRLTPAGEAFRVEARSALEHAELAVASARGVASEAAGPSLRFALGDLFMYGSVAEELLAGFRSAHPAVRVDIASQDESATHDALVAGTIDVGCVLCSKWPPRGFDGHRLLEVELTGVLLPANHPLAAQSTVSLRDLRALPWLTTTPRRWPGLHRDLEGELRARGLTPWHFAPGPTFLPSFHVAAGEGWMLASEASGAPYRGGSGAIAYRPFVEPPILLWIALVWAPPGAPLVARLVESAQRVGLVALDAPGRESVPKPA